MSNETSTVYNKWSAKAFNQEVAYIASYGHNIYDAHSMMGMNKHTFLLCLIAASVILKESVPPIGWFKETDEK